MNFKDFLALPFPTLPFYFYKGYFKIYKGKYASGAFWF